MQDTPAPVYLASDISSCQRPLLYVNRSCSQALGETHGCVFNCMVFLYEKCVKLKSRPERGSQDAMDVLQLSTILDVIRNSLVAAHNKQQKGKHPFPTVDELRAKVVKPLVAEEPKEGTYAYLKPEHAELRQGYFDLREGFFETGEIFLHHRESGSASTCRPAFILQHK